MRTILGLFALALALPALAQDTVWAVADTTAKRFPDAEVAGPAVEAGARLTVLARRGDLVRVQIGTEFGWVASSQVTDQAPEAAAPTLPEGTFDAAAIEALLRGREGAPVDPDAGPEATPGQ